MIEQQDAIEQVEGKEQTEIKRRLGKISKARGNITDNGLSKVVKEEVSEFLHKEISLVTQLYNMEKAEKNLCLLKL